MELAVLSAAAAAALKCWQRTLQSFWKYLLTSLAGKKKGQAFALWDERWSDMLLCEKRFESASLLPGHATVCRNLILHVSKLHIHKYINPPSKWIHCQQICLFLFLFLFQCQARFYESASRLECLSTTKRADLKARRWLRPFASVPTGRARLERTLAQQHHLCNWFSFSLASIQGT